MAMRQSCWSASEPSLQFAEGGTLVAAAAVAAEDVAAEDQAEHDDDDHDDDAADAAAGGNRKPAGAAAAPEAGQPRHAAASPTPLPAPVLNLAPVDLGAGVELHHGL